MNEQASRLADAVRAVLEEHGLNKRSQRIRTGIDHVTMDGMLSGVRPRMETVVRFARGFGLDVNEWLALAGYPTVEEGFNPAAALFAGLAELEAEFGRPILFSTQDALFRQASPESIEQMLANLRADMEREDARDRQGGGSPGGAMLMAAW